jgi:hypothetical protein
VDANDIQAMQQLEEPTRFLVLDAFTQALNDVFLVCIPFIIIALIIALFLKEIPLRSGAALPPDRGQGSEDRGQEAEAETTLASMSH